MSLVSYLYSFTIFLSLHLQMLLPPFLSRVELSFSFPAMKEHCRATPLSKPVFLAFLEQTSFVGPS